MTAQPPRTPRPNIPNPASYSSPSVPISVYKQLAGEMNVMKSEVAALKSENSQLRSNNHKLQNQVHQVIQAAEHLKQMVNRYDFGADTYPAPGNNAVPAQQNGSAPAIPGAANQPQLTASAPTPQPQYLQQPQAFPPQNGHRNGNGAAPVPAAMIPPAQKPAPIATVGQSQLPDTQETEGGVNGWVIFLAAIAIVLTAFGAGYMVVLPLLNNNNSTSQ